MSKDDLVDILCKNPLSPAQINLLKCIREAGPVGISREGLADKMRDGNVRSINGILLGLSRRIGSSTTDCPEFFNYYNPRYCMRPALWDAIREIPELREVIDDMSIAEIYDEFEDKSDRLELQPA